MAMEPQAPATAKAPSTSREQRATKTGDRNEPTALYRLYGPGGTLLYIGVTDDPERRFKQHRDTKPWWPQVAKKTIEWHPTRRRALAAEATAIKDETPAHNIDHNPAAQRDRVSPHCPPAGMPQDRVDGLRREAAQLPEDLGNEMLRAGFEAFTRAQAATTAFQDLVAEHGLQVEEWDTSTLDESLRNKFLAYYLERKDGTRILVVPAGQDQTVRLHAARTLLAHPAVTA